MKRLFAPLAALVASACAVQPHPDTNQPVEIGAPAAKLEGQRHIEYRVGTRIKASPEKIWSLLTDTSRYPQWNRSVISIDGRIAEGETIRLVSSAAPERTFKLKVSGVKENEAMTWGSGGRAFGGQRHFVLISRGPALTDVTMVEGLGGGMMNMIKKKLPDFRPSFDTFILDLKKAAEAQP